MVAKGILLTCFSLLGSVTVTANTYCFLCIYSFGFCWEEGLATISPTTLEAYPVSLDKLPGLFISAFLIATLKRFSSQLCYMFQISNSRPFFY